MQRPSTKPGSNNIPFGQDVLQRSGGFRRQPPAFQTIAGDSFQTVIDGFMEDIVSLFNDYGDEAYLIEHDPRLTTEGQIEKLLPIRTKYNERFNSGLVKRCRNLQDLHFAKLKKIYELPPEISGGDPVTTFLQSQEIRNYLRSLTEVERIRLALSSNDPALLHALDTCPACMQLLPEGMLERAHDFRVKRRRGKELAEAEDERLALERISGVLRSVPSAAEFVKIPQGSLLTMPGTVYTELKPEEFASYAAGSEEIERLSSEFAAMAAQIP